MPNSQHALIKTMTTMGKRLRSARVKKALTQPELAQACGWDSQSRVSQYERDLRQPKASDIRKLAKVLQVSPSWLQFGEGFDTNVPVIILGALRQVPIFGWDDVGGQAMPREWIHADNVSDQAFAVRVQGDGMEPEFYQGDMIIVDPAKIPVSGDFVLVWMTPEDLTFKQLQVDGTRRYLKPLNQRYPVLEMTEEAVFAGKIVGNYKRYL